MKTEDDELKALRKSCQNTLFVAARVVSREGIWHLAQSIRLLAGRSTAATPPMPPRRGRQRILS
eukprot:9900079-Lingulodinium_polyedra.AAC.1